MVLPTLIMLTVLHACSAFAQERIVVNTTSGPPFANTDQTGFHDLLTKEAFKRIGLDVEIVWLPGERSLINLNSGLDDATVVRIAGLEKSTQIYGACRSL